MQVAARALGGKVGKNPSERFVLKGECLPLLTHLYGAGRIHSPPGIDIS